VHHRPEAWHRLILAHLEDASGSFHPGTDAPPGDEGISGRRIRGIVKHAARSRGRHSPAVGAAILVEPGGNLGMPLTETAWRNAGGL
jgi:hypothetical protein